MDCLNDAIDVFISYSNHAISHLNDEEEEEFPRIPP
jgi:hypothetical protein